MSTGTAVAQAIPLLVSPLLTRLYSPTEFGVLSAIVAASAMLSVVFTLRYELAVVLPKEEAGAANLAALALALSIMLAGVTALAIVAFPAVATRLLTRASDYVLAVPLLAAVIGWSQILSFTANRARSYSTIASGSILQQSSSAAISVALGFFGSPVNGLVVGRVSGYVIASFYFLKCLAAQIGAWRGTVSIQAMLANARTYTQFPSYNVPYSLIGNFSREFLVLVLTAMHQTEAAGLYGLARSALTAPIGFLSASFSQVFYREAAVSIGTPEFKRLTLSFLRYLAAGLAPFFVLGWFWAPEVFAVVFGPRWHEAGQYAAVLMPVGYLSLFTSWPERVFEVRNKQHVSLIIQSTFDAATVLTVGAALFNGLPPLRAIQLYVICQVMYHLTYLGAVFQLSGFVIAAYTRFANVSLVMIGASAVVQLAVQLIPASSIVRFMVSALAAGLLSGLFLYLNKRFAAVESESNA